MNRILEFVMLTIAVAMGATIVGLSIQFSVIQVLVLFVASLVLSGWLIERMGGNPPFLLNDARFVFLASLIVVASVWPAFCQQPYFYWNNDSSNSWTIFPLHMPRFVSIALIIAMAIPGLIRSAMCFFDRE